MSRASRPLLVALALTATLSLAACGGDDSSSGSGGGSTSQPKTIAKADYISQGDAICKDLNTKLDGLTAPSSDTDGKAIAAYLRQGAQLTEDAVNKLDALGRPDADAATVDAIISGQRDTVSKARQVADTFDSGDVDGGNAQLQTLDSGSEKVKTDSKNFGFTVCGTE